MEKTFVVTGSNRGIGLELCRQLSRKGHQVIALCRHKSKELEELGVRIEEEVDIASWESVERIAEKLKGVRVDVLVNNAGIYIEESFPRLNFEGMLEQFNVNTLGALRMAKAFVGHIPHGGKIALISSWMGSIAENSYGTAYGYRMSKAALNMAGVSLAHELKSRGIAVGIYHPGYVRTDMTSFNGAIEPSESAAGLIARFEELNLQNSGTFKQYDGQPLPW